MSAIQMGLTPNHVLDANLFLKEESLKFFFFKSHQEGRTLPFPLMIITHG